MALTQEQKDEIEQVVAAMLRGTGWIDPHLPDAVLEDKVLRRVALLQANPHRLGKFRKPEELPDDG